MDKLTGKISNFDNFGAANPHSYIDKGEIWHRILDHRSAYPCQISPS